MEMLIMRDTQILIVSRNVITIPRIGETLEMDNVRFKVKDVIWHLETNRTWFEVQV